MAPTAIIEDEKEQPSTYRILEKPFGTARPIRIIAIGAGASGISIARNIKEHMKNVTLRIYEKNSAVGGTWLENQYPGCRCDIPSHNYQYSWEPNHRWSKYYSPQPEILEYFQTTARKHGLDSHVSFDHRVSEARWDESGGIWRFKVEDLQTGETVEDWGHFFINASGFLNNWKWPSIPGLDSFNGQLVHSAAWSPEVDLKGKHVAVIGNGSSGIQIVTAIQPEVKKLTSFLRSPTWITAGFGSKYAAPGGVNFDFTEDEKARFANDPSEYLMYRKGIEHELCSRFKMQHASTPEQATAAEFSKEDMLQRLGSNKSVADFIIPDFPVGCRRPTPGTGYLEALGEDNVQTICGREIVRIEPGGLILDDGEEVACDAIVCATGFDLSFVPRFPIVGRNGANLQDVWTGKRPAAYLSMTPADMPNYFMFMGPNAPVAHGSAIPILENATRYMLKMIYKAQVERYKAFCPKREAIDEFVEHADALFPRTAWAGKCRSWFRNGNDSGPITGIYPGSRLHWFHALKEPRYEDWDWDTMGPNRWQYLGNGFSVTEEDGRDLSWHFDNPDKEYDSFIY
ncbi:putative flavoprotein CzcO associated with the cation diffusion facilitator CzcD [Geosmithia morbida]|uniref:Flavoprotein CzcO associated with the cation diffusion facilitator CzcD n=1 Tax=Geosmithia morbida TaxID=1094350 RepID=A0A9P4YVE6_9HYPO|nr:putative flavoprotein CzcO associated with the cation diffusion facilitator CzcD [Geosmithia morbida]KAF4121709.1 putative flavoprotein CzcO associated with the cation diffusion facilitator CzcD [Geosmithia morbida]